MTISTINFLNPFFNNIFTDAILCGTTVPINEDARLFSLTYFKNKPTASDAYPFNIS